eukprot:6871079-Pyramimonas_sp.AAC.1
MRHLLRPQEGLQPITSGHEASSAPARRTPACSDRRLMSPRPPHWCCSGTCAPPDPHPLSSVPHHDNNNKHA